MTSHFPSGDRPDTTDKRSLAKQLRWAAIGLEGRARALGVTSTSVALLSIGLLAGLAALAVRPATGFPEVLFPTILTIEFKDARYLPQARVEANVVMDVVPEGATNSTCIGAVKVQLKGDSLYDGLGSWSLELPTSEPSDVYVGSLSNEEAAVANEKQLYDVREQEAMLPEQYQVRSTGKRLVVSPTTSVPLPADRSGITFIMRPVDNPVGGPLCFGPESFLSTRGANLQFTAPSLDVRVVDDLAVATPPQTRSAEIVANYTLDGIEGYKVEIGDDPTDDRGSLDEWTWSYSTSKTPERYEIGDVDGVLYSYSLRGPSAAAHSLAGESTEDANTFLSGVLLGVAAAGIVGALQETLNARRQGRGRTDHSSFLEEFLFEPGPEQADWSRTSTGEKQTRVLGILMLATALVAASTSWALELQLLIIYPTLTWLLRRTGGLGVARVSTVIRFLVLVFGAAALTLMVTQQSSTIALRSPYVSLTNAIVFGALLPTLLALASVKAYTSRVWLGWQRHFLALVLLVDALGYWFPASVLYSVILLLYAALGLTTVLRPPLVVVREVRAISGTSTN